MPTWKDGTIGWNFSSKMHHKVSFTQEKIQIAKADVVYVEEMSYLCRVEKYTPKH
jgi:hypothetical protein